MTREGELTKVGLAEMDKQKNRVSVSVTFTFYLMVKSSHFPKGLTSYCKAETTFTFYFTILPLSRAFLSINNREMKSESGFSLAMASQPIVTIFVYVKSTCLG